MHPMRWQSATERHGYASTKLHLSPTLFCVLDLLSTVTERWTVCAAWRSIILSTRFRKRFVSITTLPRWWLTTGGYDKPKGWSSWTKTTTNNFNICPATAVQSLIWIITETVPKSTWSIGQRYRFECESGAGLVPESESKNEENSAQGETGWWQTFG